MELQTKNSEPEQDSQLCCNASRGPGKEEEVGGRRCEAKAKAKSQSSKHHGQRRRSSGRSSSSQQQTKRTRPPHKGLRKAGTEGREGDKIPHP